MSCAASRHWSGWWRGGPAPHACSRGSTGWRAIVQLFEGTANASSTVVKLGLTAGGDAGLRREAETLARLRPAALTARAHVPAPLGLAQVEDRLAGRQSAVAGLLGCLTYGVTYLLFSADKVERQACYTLALAVLRWPLRLGATPRS